MFPSQYQDSKSGVMGQEIPSKMIIKNLAQNQRVREETGNLVDEKQNFISIVNIHERIFSKSQAYSTDELNCGDGITVPLSFMTTLDEVTRN